MPVSASLSSVRSRGRARARKTKQNKTKQTNKQKTVMAGEVSQAYQCSAFGFLSQEFTLDLQHQCNLFSGKKLALQPFCSLRAGSPLSRTRERRRAKRSGGKESGEEVPRKSFSHLAASPLDFALAATPRALVLHNVSLLAG